MKVTNDYFEKLKKEYYLTDGSIESFKNALSALIICSNLDKHFVDVHNDSLFSSNPLYIHRTFEDIKLLNILLELLDSYEFETFDDFNRFIDFISNNKTFIELKSCIDNLYVSKRIIAVEGKFASDFSNKYKNKADSIYDSINLNKNDIVQFYEMFPYKRSLYNGMAICSLIDFLNEKKDELYLLLKNDIIKRFPNYDLSTIDNYKDNDDLEAFCIMINEFDKTFSQIKRRVNNEFRYIKYTR